MSLFSRLRRRKNRSRFVTIPAFSRDAFRPHQRAARSNLGRTILAAVGVVLVYFFVWGDMGLARLLSLKRVRNELKRHELALSAQVVELDTRQRLLETDTTYIEKIARTEHHMAHPDEIIYEVVSPPGRNGN